ncbi:hypothetical protein GOP47_0024049 [Adiantum capillus-veneris]|uniref:Uncharacterized protein n=1 Tax=Adiantum capillus-veneris TaxID=13818 RepID=A0A9D4U6T1_ADICA|nr:hypothetical protein GOP47_0024049 [Adiantum capillus-veneris]
MVMLVAYMSSVANAEAEEVGRKLAAGAGAEVGEEAELWAKKGHYPYKKGYKKKGGYHHKKGGYGKGGLGHPH